jgi:hypothetical protein
LGFCLSPSLGAVRQGLGALPVSFVISEFADVFGAVSPREVYLRNYSKEPWYRMGIAAGKQIATNQQNAKKHRTEY